MAGYSVRNSEHSLTLGRDAVLPAELLPELEPDLVAALPQLEHDHLARHFFGAKKKSGLLIDCLCKRNVKVKTIAQESNLPIGRRNKNNDFHKIINNEETVCLLYFTNIMIKKELAFSFQAHF